MVLLPNTMSRIRHIAFMIVLVIVFFETTYAQSLATGNESETSQNSRDTYFKRQRQNALDNDYLYNESIYLISNYSGISSTTPEDQTIDNLLQTQTEGFYFYLRQDSRDKTIQLKNPDGSFSPLSKALSSIKKALDRDSMKIITLFLDFYVDIELEPIFRQTGLADYFLEYDTQNGWPSLRKMIDTNNRLIVFEMQKHLNSPSWLHNLNDYATGLSQAALENFPNEIESFDEKLRKDLFLFTGYKTLNWDNIDTIVRETPFLVELFKRAWMNQGKIPNFILVDTHYGWMETLLLNLRNLHIVQGAITHNNELVNYVNWQTMSNFTSGKFSFPLDAGAELMLTPSSPGYEITPKSIKVSTSSKKIFIPDFKARSLSLDQNLEVYLPLNNQTKDLSTHKNNGISNAIQFIYDPIRGSVASFGDQSRIDLPTADALHIKDHDFTVSAWIKIPKYIPGKRDYCILGTKNNSYQQGLHFLVRDNKLYMGFFNNDLAGNTLIEAGKWYHVVWRYNKMNGEQAIFLDGKLDAISSYRPAYLGRDTLYIGHADFSQTSNFVGAMDNLCIWSRVLSDKEILGISNQLIELNPSGWKNTIIYLIPALLVLFLGFSGYFLYRYSMRRKRNKSKSKETKPYIPEEKPLRNNITLFGDFHVLDAYGNEITNLFTPRLKQLFLLILLYSQREKSGISSNELTTLIWGDDSAKSTKSLRSVSILKLRKILEKIDRAEVLFNANKYSIIFSNGIYCDYVACLQLLKNKIKDREEFEQFYTIISKGEIFKGESFDWLDDYKTYICNKIVDVLSRYIGQYSLENDSDKIIQIADHILLNDPSNEEALVYKIRSLIYQNNPKSARYAYDRFCVLFQEMYGEDYPKTFEEISLV